MWQKNNINIRQLIAANKAEWDTFVEQYESLIYSAISKIFLCYLKNIPEWDLNETFQDVFVRLIKDDYHLLKTYNPAKSSLSTWLTIVARSTAIDFLRKTHPPHEPLDNIKNIPIKEEDPPSVSIDIPKNLLSGHQKLILELLFKKGQSVAQVAGILKVKEQTVRSTKHKAIERLRKYFNRKT